MSLTDAGQIFGALGFLLLFVAVTLFVFFRSSKSHDLRMAEMDQRKADEQRRSAFWRRYHDRHTGKWFL